MMCEEYFFLFTLFLFVNGDRNEILQEEEDGAEETLRGNIGWLELWSFAPPAKPSRLTIKCAQTMWNNHVFNADLAYGILKKVSSCFKDIAMFLVAVSVDCLPALFCS